MGRSNPVGKATFAEYLELEQRLQQRHELVDGYMFAMAGGTANHNRLASNLHRMVFEATDAQGCEVFISDMRLLVGNQKSYYPDVFVTCEPPDGRAIYKRSACWIAEVLSDSTEAIDRGEKLLSYRSVPGLQSYFLLSQQLPQVEVYQRLEDGTWRYQVLQDTDHVHFPCTQLALPVASLYYGVNFGGP